MIFFHVLLDGKSYKMSLFKQGYFTQLPVELRNELFRYYFTYADGLIYLDTYKQSLLFKDAVKYKPTYTDDEIYFNIRTTSNMYVPYKVHLAVLRVWLEKYVSQHKFRFMVIDKLLPNVGPNPKRRITVEQEIHENSNNAEKGKLFNFIDPLLFLQIINDNIGTCCQQSRDSDQSVCMMGDIQHEVFIYKLVKYYNDLVSRTANNSNIKYRY